MFNFLKFRYSDDYLTEIGDRNTTVSNTGGGGPTPNMLEFAIWGWGKMGKSGENGANLKLRNSSLEKTSR